MERAASFRSVIYSLVAIAGLLSATSSWTMAELPTDAVDPPSEALPPIDGEDVEQAIEAKLDQIAALQREVEELRKQLPTGQPIEIEIEFFEINQTKLRRLGIDWALNDGARPYTNGLFVPEIARGKAGNVLMHWCRIVLPNQPIERR